MSEKFNLLIFIADDYSLWVWRSIWDIRPEVTFIIIGGQYQNYDKIDQKIIEKGVFGLTDDYITEIRQKLGIFPNIIWYPLKKDAINEFLIVLETLCACLNKNYNIFIDVTDASFEKKIYAYFFAITHNNCITEIYYYDKKAKRRVILPLSWPTQTERIILNILKDGSKRLIDIYNEYCTKQEKKVTIPFISKSLRSMLNSGLISKRGKLYELTKHGMLFVIDESVKESIIEVLDSTVDERKINENCLR